MKKEVVNDWMLYPGDNAPPWKSLLLNSIKMFAILLITLLISSFLRTRHIGNQSLVMVYVLSVLLISRITPSYLYGIVAALISTFAYDYFISEPWMGFSFTIGSPITLATMLLTTFITSTLTIQMRTQARLATEREQRAQLLYEMNQQLLAARSTRTIVQLAADYLAGHLEKPVVFYTASPKAPGGAIFATGGGDHGDTGVFHTDDEYRFVDSIFRSGSNSSGIFGGLEHPVFYTSVLSKGNVLGVIGISCNVRDLSQNQITFVQMLAGQVALALELQHLADEQTRILMEAEREQMRSNLLRAISHDLRTPLTSILGASSTILEQKDLTGQTHESLVRDIRENAQWLIRMVENLLTITRISRDTTEVHKTMEAAEEVVSQAVSIVRKRFPDCHIGVLIPNDLLMVPMDATLISQVIINLLENAIKNSPTGAPIMLELKQDGTFARFEISDNGQGIAEHLLDHLFEPHSPYREKAVDASRGMGIGLSICRTIIQAHRGRIEGANRPEGGALFYFILPLNTGEEDER